MKNNEFKHENILTERLIQSATIQYRDNFYAFSKHMHSTIELYYFTHGTCCMDIGNQTISCQEGDFVLIPPEVIHSLYLTSEEPCIFKHVHFFTEILSQIQLKNITEHPTDIISALTFCYTLYHKTSHDKKLYDFMSEIISEFHKKTIFSKINCNLYLIQLLFYILESSEKDFTKYTPSHSIQNLYISKTLAYIKQHYNTKFQISDIADTLNISTRYLSKIFYKHMNMTLLNYINVYRMNQAIELMQNTDLSLTEISHQIGMNDSQHFSKLFRSTIGSPPFQYRKELKKQSEKEH